MGRLPRLSGRQVEQAFRRLGFAPLSGGPRWRHQDGRQPVIHSHPTLPMPVGTLRHVLSLARVSLDEFLGAL